MPLEQTALGLVLLMVTFVNGGTLVFVRIWQREYEGTLWWALTHFLFFASFLTAGIYGMNMPPHMASFANATYVLALLTLAYGFYRFFDASFRRRLYGGLFLLWLVVGNVFAFAVPDIAGRIAVATVITVVVSYDVVDLIRRNVKPGLRLAYFATALIFPLAVLVMVLRLIGALSTHGYDVGYDYAAVNTLSIMLAIVMTLGLTFGQVMMISARFQTDLMVFANRFRFEALHDPLTGAGNRRLFLDATARLLAIRRRHVRPFALISLDLDLFKRVNDTHGHANGDKVLKAVAETLTHNLRGEDVLARIGGEEFAILMPETGKAEAANAAERHRQAIEAIVVPTSKGAIRITCSFGVTEGEPQDSAPDAVMQRADEALYRAKREGRNRVVVS